MGMGFALDDSGPERQNAGTARMVFRSFISSLPSFLVILSSSVVTFQQKRLHLRLKATEEASAFEQSHVKGSSGLVLSPRSPRCASLGS
ncbi:hypothetical protein BDZ45DRAFT_76509 [Acephala macrosclerotiorum]|nr:hypothetical protein BDZ45DRAFT_76509 [Acephala macrosclerotiorum]